MLFRSRKVGLFEDKEITAAIGRFGPYLKHNNKFYSIPKNESVYGIGEKQAIETILAKREADSKKIVKEYSNDKDLQVLNGRWGVYIKYKKNNFKIPKKYKDKDLSYDECMEIINTTEDTKKTFKKRK